VYTFNKDVVMMDWTRQHRAENRTGNVAEWDTNVHMHGFDSECRLEKLNSLLAVHTDQMNGMPKTGLTPDNTIIHFY
jgi:hypothetical protein